MEKIEKNGQLMEKIVSLCKRRGFVYPSSEIYGGLANSWDFGPYGVELKNNIKQYWWKKVVQEKDDVVGLDSAIIMNPKVWEASGHVANFSDPLIECKKCHERFRADDISGYEVKISGMNISWKKESGIKCPKCGSVDSLDEPRIFNLMFETSIGPVNGAALYYQLGQEDYINKPDKEGRSKKGKEIEEKIRKGLIYLRPETAQGIFIDFKNIIDTSRVKVPFGVAQIGKAFRNEITPGNFIFRTREFEQMEIEYFFNPEKDKWEEKFDMWLDFFKKWMDEIGIDSKKLFFHDIEKEELAHYSKRTIDVEFDFPFGRKELFGLAYRTDFDLKSHKISYRDPETQEEYIPHVIEPSMGVDRMMLALLTSAYTEEEANGEVRTVLKFDKKIAPVKIAVFPLLRNKPELVKKAREIYDSLKSQWMCEFDDNGNVGKRYRRQDEIGTPYCITVDFDSLEKGDVTVRDRDTMKQERIKIEELKKYFNEKFSE